MKKTGKIALSITLIGGLLLQTGCFGSFKLTRKLYDFNNSMGDKLVKEVVFLVFTIIPVYGACAFVDAVILNLVEFWSGTNPLAMQEGQIETKTMVSNGKTYEISAMKNKFVIKELKGPDAGKVAEIAYNPSEKTWAVSSQGETHLLTKELANGTVNVFTPDGAVRNYPMSSNGFAQAQAEMAHQ